MFLDCPAYFDEEGSVRCGLPAEVEDRYAQESTGGQLESAKIRCPRGHWFNGPIAFLTWKSTERGASPSTITPAQANDDESLIVPNTCPDGTPITRHRSSRRCGRRSVHVESPRSGLEDAERPVRGYRAESPRVSCVG